MKLSVKAFLLLTLLVAALPSGAGAVVSEQDMDHVDLVVKLEVNGRMILEKRVTPRFGEKRTLSKTFYDDKTEYELQLLPSRYNDNAALVEASIVKISDFGPTHHLKTLLGSPQILTLNKMEGSAESSSKGTKVKLSVLPTFHDL